MFTAISSDKPDFVEIFMENNCDINLFLTYRRLLELYNDVNLLKINNDCLKKNFYLKDTKKLCVVQTIKSDSAYKRNI